MKPTPEERFWAKVVLALDSDCWLWSASKNTKGYGQFMFKGSPRLAHRMAYYFTHGDIPAGLTIDHICWTRACVNPNHLRPATQRDQLGNKRGWPADLRVRQFPEVRHG